MTTPQTLTALCEATAYDSEVTTEPKRENLIRSVGVSTSVKVANHGPNR
jgi:hypothetical protein